MGFYSNFFRYIGFWGSIGQLWNCIWGRNRKRLSFSKNEAPLTTQSAYNPEDLAPSQEEADLTEYALKYARLDQYRQDAVEAIIRTENNRCRAENALCSAAAYSGRISMF